MKSREHYRVVLGIEEDAVELSRTQIESETLAGALRRLPTSPAEVLLREWHWKAALFSASTRSVIFLVATLRAGWGPAVSAMSVEFVLRIATAGICGSFTQSLRLVQPTWHGMIMAAFLVPLFAHGLEFGIHRLNGTPHLVSAMGASIVLSLLSTLFHSYATRQGAYLTGGGANSLSSDFRRTPALVAGFLRAGTEWIWKTPAAPAEDTKT